MEGCVGKQPFAVFASSMLKLIAPVRIGLDSPVCRSFVFLQSNVSVHCTSMTAWYLNSILDILDSQQTLSAPVKLALFKAS